jgi:hypothetical protein
MDGWHCVYQGLDISFEKALEFRDKLGDDENRIRLDSLESGKPKQVLFSMGFKIKKIPYYIPRWWFKKMGKKLTSPILHLKTYNRNPPLMGRMVWRFNKCPCNKTVHTAISCWNKQTNQYYIEILHADGSDPCNYSLPHGIRLLARRLVGLN